VINLFNESAVIAPNTTTLTARNDGSLETFNPFPETPQQGVDWDYGPRFGQAQAEEDSQDARTFRFLVGLRF
jgi:hypothetical protein